MGSLQKAWFYRGHGPVDVLEFGDVEVPQISSPDQVLIKVHAAALNPIDYQRRNGYIKNPDIPVPHVPGYDVAGVVAKVGEDVKKFKEGDEVYGDIVELSVVAPKQIRSLAQYTVTEERVLALKPKSLSFEEAASLPVGLLSAQEGFERAGFKPGQSVLILGGAGGVGTLAIQLAKNVYGASLVATTTSTGKLEFVRTLGADVAIDYTTTKYYELPDKYDFVYDAEITLMQPISKPPAKPPVSFYSLKANGDNLAKLNAFLEDGSVKPVLDPKGQFTFSQVKEAFEYLETSRARGKVVISPIN